MHTPLQIAALNPSQRRHLARRHPHLVPEQPAWVVSGDPLLSARLLELQRIVSAGAADSRRIDELIEALVPRNEIPSSASLLQARRNAEARDALAREFGLLTSAEVADLAGSGARNRAALAHRWKREGRLFSVLAGGVERWPGFQVDAHGQPRAVIREVLAALPATASDWEKALWFTSVSGWLGGARPVDRLTTAPQDVVVAARREGEGLVF